MAESLGKKLEHHILQDYGLSSRLEWLETNGLGGWAGSSVSGAHTRRYHGLLVAALNPPLNRLVLLSRLDETVCLGPLRFELGCNQFPGTIHPQGFWRLNSFTWDMFPVFEYKIGGIVLKKTVAALRGENTTLVLYEVLSATEPFGFELQPFIAARDFHSLSHANDTIDDQWSLSNGIWSATPYHGLPAINISVPGAHFEEQPDWYYDFEYQREAERGFEFKEDLFSYGKFKLDLNPGGKLGVIVSTHPAAGRNAFELFEKEAARRRTLLAAFPSADDFAKTLALAADQFIVQRGNGRRTIIAGYPWFTDWGRDTMIALPGLCLITRRYEDARQIFRTYRQSLRHGLIPNYFPDSGAQPAYNTADGSLWFFIAIQAYLDCTGDERFVKDELLSSLLEIISAYRNGTHFDIHIEADGLLWAGDKNTPLTWMDAKVGNEPVTPRLGKAVEINALWYNALMVAAELCGKSGNQSSRQELLADALRAKQSFSRVFWNREKGCLYDYVNRRIKDDAIRPNQILAIGLPYPLLEDDYARSVLKTVQDKLLTPYGLRTLEPGHADYCGRCTGGMPARDYAYHQGTVWPWLLGPYAVAVKRYGNTENKERLERVFDNLKIHLFECGLGSISEIFDGDEPYTPRGCPFQAWSVGEVLRAYLETRSAA